MAWKAVSVKIGDQEVQAHQSTSMGNLIFSIAATVEISEGDTFSLGKKTLTAMKVVDLANRGETFLVEAKESKSNDKRAKGRSDPEDGGSADIGEDDA